MSDPTNSAFPPMPAPPVIPGVTPMRVHEPRVEVIPPAPPPGVRSVKIESVEVAPDGGATVRCTIADPDPISAAREKLSRMTPAEREAALQRALAKREKQRLYHASWRERNIDRVRAARREAKKVAAAMEKILLGSVSAQPAAPGNDTVKA